MVALRESERTVRESGSRTNDTSDELVASECSENEEGLADAAEASGEAEHTLQDTERAQNE